MSAALNRGFQVIGEDDAEPVQTPEQTDLAKANAQMLLLSLRALSQRALTAISNLMTICLVASAWWLWRSVLGSPTVFQLVAIGGYALFVLAIDVVRRRR